jgi:hypothetical protein
MHFFAMFGKLGSFAEVAEILFNTIVICRYASTLSLPKRITSSVNARIGIFPSSLTLIPSVFSEVFSNCGSKHKLNKSRVNGFLCFTPLRIFVLTS